MKKIYEKTGITLIALIITIIIMLILAGVVIKTLTGEEGLITKAMQVKQRTEYQMAKEEVDIKLMEIVASCEERGVEYNIDEIYEAIEKDDEKTIEKIFNKGTGAVKSGVSETIVDLSDIVVSVKKYSKYKFLVGEEGEIDGVLEGDVTNVTEKKAFKSINVFEAALLGTTVADDDTGINNGREQITVDKDEYENLKTTVQNLSKRMDEKDNIGKTYSNTATVNCKKNTGTTEIASVQVPAGTYVIHTRLAIESQVKETGFIQNKIVFDGTTTFSDAYFARSYHQTDYGGYTVVHNSAIMSCENNVTIKLQASNWYPSDYDIVGKLTAVKIK